MNLLLKPISTSKASCIRHTAFDNLFVIPYVKGRLVFAELAARFVLEGHFDQVLVDLPCFLNDQEPNTLPVHLFPLTSSLVIRNNASSFVSIPFVPNDAACIAIAATQMIRKHSPTTLQFVDDSHVISYQQYLHQPEPELAEDYSVHIDGLSRYFSEPFKQLGDNRDSLSDDTRFYTEHRAGEVSEHVVQALASGKRTLLVCEYSLWRLVDSMLDSGVYAGRSRLVLPWSDVSAAIVLENPCQMWAMGLIDDYPVIVEEFYRLFQEGKLDEFDKLDRINARLAECIADPRRPLSVRSLLTFRRYLVNRLSADRCFVPLPMQHLFDAAHAALGRHFSHELERQLLHYPVDEMETVLHFLKINEGSLRFSNTEFEIPELCERISYSMGILPPDPGKDYAERLGTAARVHPHLSKREQAELGTKQGGVTWQLASEYKMHRNVCTQVREMLEMEEWEEDFLIKRSWGSTGHGIDMRATIASLVSGENAIYIKQRRSRKLTTGRLNDNTPTVFLFEDDLTRHGCYTVHDSNATQRKWELDMLERINDDDPPPDCVESVYATYNEEASLCDGHIDLRKLSSIVFLCTNHMGTERYKHIARLPEQRQCRHAPQKDPELELFSYNDIGIAWAIKYALDCIIVVAREGWSPSQLISDYAHSCNVDILTTSLERLSEDTVERMKYSHSASTPLKISPRREEILNRYITH